MSLRHILSEEGLVASGLTDEEQEERDLIARRMMDDNDSTGKNPFVNEVGFGVYNIRLWTANRSDREPTTWTGMMFGITARLRGFGETFDFRVEAERDLKNAVIPYLKSSGRSHFIFGW